MIFKRKETAEDLLSRRPIWQRITYVVLGVIVMVNLGLAWYWSRSPDVFWVNQGPASGSPIVGYATTDSLIRVAETLLDKPGGYLTNDVAPPGVFLDNIPNWELGVLQQVRDLARVTRNDHSRSQSQSREDVDLAVAEPKIFFDNDSWVFPPSESEYRDAIEGFISYRERLSVGASDAQFFARADNLREWLAQVEKRLGSLSRRLGDSVVQDVINTDLAGDRAATASSNLPDRVQVRTSWFEIDDIFFEARGTAWALVHFFRAAEFDFANVLEDKNAETSVRQIIRELEASLAPLRSPMVLNGGGYGLFANHSLVMANYLARANAAVINLRELLDQG
ncbi:MAG: DUF2333 family protein [Woeseiaceae bacterium]